MKKTDKSKKSNALVFLGIIAIATVLCVVIIFCTDWVVDMNAGDGRTEKDYVTKTWVVEQISERQIREGGITKYSYDFIQPAGENFNLSLPMKGRNQDIEEFSEWIAAGDTIEAKVYVPEWQAMQSDNLWKKLKRFVIQDNREVEVFKLTLRGETLFDKSITFSDVNFRKGGNLSVSHIILILIALAAITYTIGVLRQKAKKKKA